MIKVTTLIVKMETENKTLKCLFSVFFFILRIKKQKSVKNLTKFKENKKKIKINYLLNSAKVLLYMMCVDTLKRCPVFILFFAMQFI